jgi:hypothetical protein
VELLDNLPQGIRILLDDPARFLGRRLVLIRERFFGRRLHASPMGEDQNEALSYIKSGS